VYRVQRRNREANLHIEQLKLCRATREELRERRRQNRRMREQRPRPEREEGRETDSDDAVSEEEGHGRPLYSYAPMRDETDKE
jgi:U3 small nucleolar RNA-associated protein 14